MKITYLPITCVLLFSAQSSIANDCKCDTTKEICINMMVAGQQKHAIVTVTSSYDEKMSMGSQSQSFSTNNIEQGIGSEMCEWYSIDAGTDVTLKWKRMGWKATFTINNIDYTCTVPDISLNSKISRQVSVTFDPNVGTASNNEGNITAACHNVDSLP